MFTKYDEGLWCLSSQENLYPPPQNFLSAYEQQLLVPAYLPTYLNTAIEIDAFQSSGCYSYLRPLANIDTNYDELQLEIIQPTIQL